MKIFATSTTKPDASLAELMATMDAEIARGRLFYENGLIVQAYMDPTYSRTFMILEAASVEDAKAQFDTYPQVHAGLIEFEFVPLIGMPAIAQVHRQGGEPLPTWWPEQPNA